MTDIITLLRKWCELKISLWQKESNVVFKQGDIWWCKIGINVGEEMFGKGTTFTRPVLVYKKFTKNSFLGLPLTQQAKQGSWYVRITMHSKMNWVILNQARIFDKKRFSTKIGTLDDRDFQEVKERFLKFYST